MGRLLAARRLVACDALDCHSFYVFSNSCNIGKFAFSIYLACRPRSVDVLIFIFTHGFLFCISTTRLLPIPEFLPPIRLMAEPNAIAHPGGPPLTE